MADPQGWAAFSNIWTIFDFNALCFPCDKSIRNLVIRDLLRSLIVSFMSFFGKCKMAIDHGRYWHDKIAQSLSKIRMMGAFENPFPLIMDIRNGASNLV